MYSKENFWADIEMEFGIVKHLFTKIPEGQMGYRPTPEQRSTIELLQFLSNFGTLMMESILNENMDKVGWYKEERLKVTPENFLSAIDTEISEMKVLFAQFTDEEMAKLVDLFKMGFGIPKNLMLMSTVFKQLIMYKMQLFLYIKASGNTSISTINLTRGVDAPVQ